MPKFTDAALCAAIRAAGLSVFQDRRSDAKARVSDCLDGLTNYFSEGTRRFHKARVLSCQLTHSGAFLRVLETCSANFEGTRRVTRMVLFDVNGTVVWRPELGDSASDRAGAEKQFWAWFETFDPAAYYADEFNRMFVRQSQAARKAKEAARAAMRLIEKKV